MPLIIDYKSGRRIVIDTVDPRYDHLGDEVELGKGIGQLAEELGQQPPEARPSRGSSIQLNVGVIE